VALFSDEVALQFLKAESTAVVTLFLTEETLFSFTCWNIFLELLKASVTKTSVCPRCQKYCFRVLAP